MILQTESYTCWKNDDCTSFIAYDSDILTPCVIMRSVIKQGNDQRHIGLNAQLLSLGQNYRAAGISWYIYNLLRNLDEIRTDKRYTVFLNESTFQASRNLHLHYSSMAIRQPIRRILWEQWVQPMIIQREKMDLLHALAFVAPFAVSCPVITTIYDLSFLRYPKTFRPFNRLYLRTFTQQSAKRAASIITISESTRQDVINLLGASPDDVYTIYCGVDDAFQPLPESDIAAFRAQQGLPEQFILFIGTIEPRKNVAGLIKAYAAWKQRDPNAPPLFMGGGKGWYYEEIFALVASLDLKGSVIFPGYLPQEDLRLWYNAATIFVYPSHFEGFGLPVLEALACGTPVITSNVSSLPEVAGDAALLMDPNDPQALSEAMQHLSLDLDLQHWLRQKGFVQRARFSWQKSALETNQVYEKTFAKLRQ